MGIVLTSCNSYINYFCSKVKRFSRRYIVPVLDISAYSAYKFLILSHYYSVLLFSISIFLENKLSLSFDFATVVEVCCFNSFLSTAPPCSVLLFFDLKLSLMVSVHVKSGLTQYEEIIAREGSVTSQ